MQIHRILLTSLIALNCALPAQARTPPSQFYRQTNFVSLKAGGRRDKQLINPWGIAFTRGTFIWITDNNAGVSTLYNAHGRKQKLVVTIPTPANDTDPPAPTGIVVNPNALKGTSSDFGGALFVFSTENGTLATWKETDNAMATLAVDNSAKGAIYKGLALAATNTGDRLYATNFGKGVVEVYDTDFNQLTVAGGFADADIPSNFSPFGIQNIDGNLFVTYAEPDGSGDEINGTGNGFVDKFDTDGNLLQRFAAHGQLNSPWGVALAPTNFGPLSNLILVGNFGDGAINAYDANTGAFVNQVKDRKGNVIANPGLWALTFGDGKIGSTNELFFTAGGADQSTGVFGALHLGTLMSGTGGGPY